MSIEVSTPTARLTCLGLLALAVAAALATDGMAAPQAVSLMLVTAISVLGLYVVGLWCGASVFFLAPGLAALLAMLAGGGDAVAFFEDAFAHPTGRFIAQYLPVFLMGAIFGRAMADSGCAHALADAIARRVGRAWIPAAIALVCGVLVMGGVGVFVIAFAMLPIARAALERAALPMTLAPGAIAFGAFTLTMTAMPGAPSLTNIVAADTLGTTAFSGMLPGLAASGAMALTGAWWLWRLARLAPAEHAPGGERGAALGPPPVTATQALIPIFGALAVNAVMTLVLVKDGPADQSGALLGPTYLAVIAALVVGTALTGLAGGARSLTHSVNAGAAGATLPLLGTALGYGFGTTLATLPGIDAAIGGLLGGAAAGSMAGAALGAGLFSAMIGSSSGGLALWMDQHAALHVAAGLDPDMLHRIAALASGVFDTLPHSAAVIALLTICGQRHRDCYGDIFVLTVLVPLLGLVVGLALV